MSNSEFEDRLNRIKAGARQTAASTSVRAGGRFPYVRLYLGAFLLICGVLLIRLANDNYESIRDQYGLAAVAGLGLGGLALTLFGTGIKLRLVRQFVRNASDTQLSVDRPTIATRHQVQTSVGARLFFSLLGLGLGGLACLLMYVGNAGRQLGVIGQVDAETARDMATASIVAAFFLVAFAVLIGFIGLFVRRLPMRRVPIFTFLGAMVLYTSFQTLRIHPSNWTNFMDTFTRFFTDQLGK